MLSTVSSLPVSGDAGQAGVGCAHREPLWLRAIGTNRPQEKAVAPQPRLGAGKGPPLQSSGGVAPGQAGGSVPGEQCRHRAFSPRCAAEPIHSFVSPQELNQLLFF